MRYLTIVLSCLLGAMAHGQFYVGGGSMFSARGSFSAGDNTPLPWEQPYVISVGQSLSIGTSGTPIMAPYDTNTMAKTIPGGPIYTAGTVIGSFPPAFEHGNTETHCLGFGTALSLNSRPTFTNDPTTSTYGVGSTAYSGLKKGTAPYTNSLWSITLAKASSPNYYRGFWVPGIICIHGETDRYSTTYSNDVREWQSDYNTDIKAVTGQAANIPMFHSQISSWSSPSYNSATSASPYQLLAAHKVDPTNIVIVGPKYMLPYVSDKIHLQPQGYRWLGEMYAKAWHRRLVRGVIAPAFYPTNISRIGAQIDLVFSTVTNLALDVSAVATNANWGFEYTDSTSSASISSVAWVAPSGSITNTVRVTLSGTPTGSNKRIRYAFTGNPGASSYPRGNLRNTDISFTSPSGYSLYDWCLHFDEVCP